MTTFLKAFISRMGGKKLLAERIVNVMPEHKTYVECFVGAGSVFLYKPLAPINVISDIDPFITDLYTDLISFDNLDFMEATAEDCTRERFFEMTGKAEFASAQERFRTRMLVNQLSYAGKNKCYGYDNKEKQTKRIPKFRDLKRYFTEYKDKFKHSIILNDDYRNIISHYDNEDTLIYLDPPYSNCRSSWGYKDRPSREQLKDTLKTIKGKFIMSYDNEKDNKTYFENEGFYVYNIQTKYSTKIGADGRNLMQEELLITNYPIENATERLKYVK